MIICYTCTAGHTALLVFAHNKNYFVTRVWFPWLQCTHQPIGFTACSMGATRKPQQYNYNVMGVPVAIVRVPIEAVMVLLEQTLCV